ncbi:sulfite exporter TauE/SafE family protein [Sulfurospirillum sp. 1307]|jgi:sulfite exporter TauE/SafE
MDNINLFAIISVALLGSLGHCIGMCGGFIVAYSSAKIDPKSSRISQFFSHMFYSIGRVTSYTFLGAVFGYIGSVISFSKTSTGYLYFFIGLLMVLMGLSLMGKIRFLTSLECSISSDGWVKKIFSSLIHSKSYLSFYGLGLLNGFLPCGLVYFFAISAAATGSMFWGAVTMFIFGISTIPVLLSFGFIVGFLKSTSFREIMIKTASVVIMAYGIYISYEGFMAVRG